MGSVLHLFKTGATPLAVETIRQQIAAGDRVSVVLLDDAAPPPIERLTVRRVPSEIDYRALLDLVFEADQVIAW